MKEKFDDQNFLEENEKKFQAMFTKYASVRFRVRPKPKLPGKNQEPTPGIRFLVLVPGF